MSEFEKAKALVKEQAELVFNPFREKLEELEKTAARGESVNELNATIEKMNDRISELQTELDTTNATMKAGSFDAGSSKGNKIEENYTEAFVKSLTGGRLSDIEVTVMADYQKSMNVSSNTAGGYLVPKAMATEIMRQVEAKVPFFSLSEIRNTMSLESPFLVQVTKGTAGLPTEVAVSANTAEGTIEEVRIRAYDIDAEPSVTRTLLEDAAFDVAAFVTWNAADVIGDTFGNLIVNGSGTNQPKGLSNSANTTSTYTVIKEVDSTANNSFELDDLIDLKFDLDARYAANPCAFVVSRSAVKTMRKLKDNYGQYLWQPSLQVGAPAMFDGDAVFESPYIEALADGSRSVFYGDWKKGTAIVRHTGGTYAITDPFTNKRLLKVYLKERLGFGTVDARALRALKTI